MISPVYDWIVSILSWFFGSLYTDPFVSGILQWVVFIFLLVLFLACFIIPAFMVFRWFWRRLK